MKPSPLLDQHQQQHRNVTNRLHATTTMCVVNPIKHIPHRQVLILYSLHRKCIIMHNEGFYGGICLYNGCIVWYRVSDGSMILFSSLSFSHIFAVPSHTESPAA